MRKALLAVCVAACSDPEVGQVSQPIVNGTLDTGDPATVYLDLGGGGCSGTLVSPKTIVTAKHCLSSQMTAFFGSDVSDAGTWLSVVHKSGNQQGDIAMLTLESEGPASPIPLVNADLAQYIDHEIRIAGFGVTSENGGGDGTKRQATASINSVEGDIMYANNQPSGTCYGDSGGPNFMTIGSTEFIIGVTSFGTEACGQGLDGNVRIDTYRDWIRDYIAAHDVLPPEESCDADGVCVNGCPAPDPDCPCNADGFCTDACPDQSSDPDCCATDGTCNAACGDVDADCMTDPAGNGETDDGDDPGKDGGCTTGGSPALLLGLALIGLVRRRRSA